MSFDVASLFTNVLVDLVIDDITNKLFSGDVAPELSFVHSKNQLHKWSLKNLWNSVPKVRGMFIDNGKLFSQIDGVAMCDSLGPRPYVS